MIYARARPLFSSPFSVTSLSTKIYPTHLRLSFSSSTSSSRRSLSTVSMSSTPQIVEHIVLFKAKEDADSSKISSMLNGLNGLVSLDQVLHLSTVPVHQVRAASASGFTHVLHSRYGSKEDLNAYAAHPDHVRVVKESVLPICEDIMAVDWIANHVPGTAVPPPGSVGKITFLKLKDNVTDEAKTEVLEVIKGLNEKFPGIDQITVGENFSPARAKGFSIASIAYFRDLSEMEAVDAQKELVNLEKDKVREFIDATIVVDFVVPSTSQSSSL